jgi:Protein of unknown function (DUF3107)
VRADRGRGPIKEEVDVEVKIGVQYAPRELVIDSAQSPAEVEASVSSAISAAEGVLSLVDEKGRRIIVPVSKIAYVEIAEASARQVGFSVSR